MKSSLRFHKASAWVLIIMGLVHIAAHIATVVLPPSTPAEASLFQTMKSFPLPDLLPDRNMWKIYQGLSLVFSATSILWGLSNLSAVRGGGSLEFLRRQTNLNLTFCAILFVIGLIYFITPPNAFLLIALILAIPARIKLPGNTAQSGGV